LYYDRWILAVEITMKNFSGWSLPTLIHPSYRYIATHDRKKMNEMGQYRLHLWSLLSLSSTCFAPGNFLLGGRVLKRDDIFQFGLDVLEGCWYSSNVTSVGIGPESTIQYSFFLM
jgi:mannosyl-oligosaccharide alpha-1,2-mannosidase